MATNFHLFRLFVGYLLLSNVSISQCLNVTCHNQIGSHPFHRMNTCYITRIDRLLEINEHLTFIQSYGSPDKIKTLDISTPPDDPGIDHVPVEAFHWFPHLESLRVNSKLTSITATDLELAANLTQLMISNQLLLIPVGIFPLNNNLTFLSFESNRISTIDDYAFKGLNHLFSLKLHKNQLETIKRHTLSGLNVLHVLNLNENKIRVIESGAFEDLSELEFLHLQQNRLEILYDDIFHGLINLIDISLRENRITDINESLKNLMSIKNINLDHNHIDNLDLNEFAKFPSLVVLRLINTTFSFDKTKQSRNEHTPTTSKLQYLDLDKNNLSNPLDLQSLGIFSKLKELSLDNNLYYNFNWSGEALKMLLPNLKFISLEGNGIDQSVLTSITDEVNTFPTVVYDDEE
ncbi:leucine-rich repeat-containing protein 15-like [Sitodiplosis mosellana]|uniref:leucine-rich repeat-containing protein 15-like n=1 Tax=Sitodiplosis mosellana TaxID=263140 RepID=UPI002443A8FB|nr:leucine-rich repeat-containing protein 15-like [Sitodiplosis mosellana]